MSQNESLKKYISPIKFDIWFDIDFKPIYYTLENAMKICLIDNSMSDVTNIGRELLQLGFVPTALIVNDTFIDPRYRHDRSSVDLVVKSVNAQDAFVVLVDLDLSRYIDVRDLSQTLSEQGYRVVIHSGATYGTLDEFTDITFAQIAKRTNMQLSDIRKLEEVCNILTRSESN